MTDFSVDTEALRRGAARWGEIAETVEEVKLKLDSLAPSTYGHDYLVTNATNMQTKWVDGLRIVGERSDGTTTALRDSADEYDTADEGSAADLTFEV